jgi:hypothetical protein
MYRPGWILGAVLLVMITVPASSAGAHRWDGAFSVRSGPPGTVVTVFKAHKVVWNPIGLDDIGTVERPKQPTLTLLERDRPKRNVRFRVPAVPPGTYTVAAYDGSERGTHYTWTVLRVTRPGLAETGPPFSLGLWGVALLVGGFLLVCTSRLWQG